MNICLYAILILSMGVLVAVINLPSETSYSYQGILQDGTVEAMRDCYEKKGYKMCDTNSGETVVVEDYWENEKGENDDTN